MGQKIGKASFDGRAKPFVNRKYLETGPPSPTFVHSVKVYISLMCPEAIVTSASVSHRLRRCSRPEILCLVYCTQEHLELEPIVFSVLLSTHSSYLNCRADCFYQPAKSCMYLHGRNTLFFFVFYVLSVGDFHHRASPTSLFFCHYGDIGEVPGESIKALWQEFNLCADGWGIDPVFFEQLCKAMATSMGIETNEKNNKALFSAFDTDKVGDDNYTDVCVSFKLQSLRQSKTN